LAVKLLNPARRAAAKLLARARKAWDSKDEFAGVSWLSSCDYSIQTMTGSKPSFANDML
jgi:hypothetical protein